MPRFLTLLVAAWLSYVDRRRQVDAYTGRHRYRAPELEAAPERLALPAGPRHAAGEVAEVAT